MKSHGGALENNLIDFSANVSPLGMHPAGCDSLRRLSLNPNCCVRYPDSSASELKNLLSDFWEIPNSNIALGSGAADLIYEISKTFSRGKKNFLILEPSFSEYESSLRSAGVDEKNIFHAENAVSFGKNFSILFAASPANPTGKILSIKEIVKIERLCEKNDAIFVLDACFAQFSKNAETTVRKIISQKERFKRLVVLNAFTKFYGMAGIRLGYALCFDEKIASELNERIRPWAVSSVALECGISVLKSEIENPGFWKNKIQSLVEKEKFRFYQFFEANKIEFELSEANFILCKLGGFLASKKIKVERKNAVSILGGKFALRNCDDFFGLDENWFRIAIKSCEENSLLLDLLDSKIEKKSARRAVPIMVQGTMSNAGKSLLVAALCRIFKKDGFAVAPFKSQNMALNSGVTADGLEMGRAQIMQAEAAGLLPDVRMNPILLKPNSDTGSQVIVNGEVKGTMSAKDYFAFRKNLVPEIVAAYDSLAEENDIIVIEGAGSPAEINLKENDIVNMGLAELVDSPVLLCGDIGRGGVFAALYGTFALLSEKERARVKGFLVNKFRGDPKLLENGLSMIRDMTGVPVLGVVPFIKNLRLDDEDSLSSKFLATEKTNGKNGTLSIFVVKLPFISNFTDLNPLYNLDFVNLQYFESKPEYDSLCEKFGTPDLLILPGTKNTLRAMKFLVETKLDELITSFAKKNPVVGICGGFQLLGKKLDDSLGAESGSKIVQKGLGLLPVETVFSEEKMRSVVNGNLPKIDGFYSELSGAKIHGYEIHQGKSECPENCAFGPIVTAGFTLGTYVHGFFDSTQILCAILKILFRRKKIAPPDFSSIASETEIKEKEFDRLEKIVRESIDMEKLYRILGLKLSR